MSSSETSALFISWIGFHGRSAGIATELGIPCMFVSGGTGPAPIRYLRAWVETRRLMKRHRPSTVFVMLPPVVALLSAAMSAPRGARIIGDLHTGVFTNAKWSWALGPTMRILRRRGFAIVTGEELASRTRGFGVQVLQLHDMIDSPISLSPTPDEPTLASLLQKEYVLVPLAYAFDEPIDALLAAATASPNITWVLTGRPPADVVEKAPANVVFPGFVSRDDYRRLVASASVMAALTTQENTMQRVGYEALSEGKALVTSGSRVLREYFADAALYVTAEPASIESQVRLAMESRGDQAARMAERRRVLLAEQSLRLDELRSILKTKVTSAE